MRISPIIANLLNGCLFELTGEPLLEGGDLVAHNCPHGELALETIQSLLSRFILLSRQFVLLQLFHLLF